MLIHAANSHTDVVPHLKGGEGEIIKRTCLSELPSNAKMFAQLRLEPGCSIGEHRHEGEYEIFYGVEGELVLNDNGTEGVLRPGDFAICRDGESHALMNRSDKTAAIFAAIIKTAM